MGLFHYLWSRTAASNATADSNVNWQEGQAPSSVNDSARAMMASAAAFRDDIAGAIVTGGTSTAYTVTSYQVFDTLAHMSGQMIAFTPHATNTGTSCTLNVDGLGAKPLRSSPSVELPAGSLILGTPYVALYNNSDAAWYLQGGVGAANPYSIPLGGGMDFWGSTAPNALFAFPLGQAASRTTYSAFFAMVGTTYGAGDGSTTFNLPNKSGRVSAMKEASASLLTSSYFGGNSTTLGAVGGAESQTLALGHLPTGITSTGTFTLSETGLVKGTTTVLFSTNSSGATVWRAWNTADTITVVNPSASGTVTSNNTGGGAHATVQPTIICNYIIRIL